LGQMLAKDARSRMQAANQRENHVWQEVKTRADWEKYRDTRLQALRASLGRFPSGPRELTVRVTRELQGDHHQALEIRLGHAAGTRPLALQSWRRNEALRRSGRELSFCSRTCNEGLPRRSGG
jgi:hypothetical protein